MVGGPYSLDPSPPLTNTFLESFYCAKHKTGLKYSICRKIQVKIRQRNFVRWQEKVIREKIYKTHKNVRP